MGLTQQSMVALLREVLYGPPKEFAFVLNPGDAGLLASLDKLSAEQASARPEGRSSIAAHTDHLAYSFTLLNRWLAGDKDAFSGSDYADSWNRQVVTDDAWSALRKRLAEQAAAWVTAIGTPREWDPMTLNGAIGSIVHLAYHVGALRQIDAAARGPRATD
jgi:hypothetical protein